MTATPLESNANLRTPPTFGLEENKPLWEDRQEMIARRGRFRLQARARWLLRGERRKDKKGKDAPYRIDNCLLALGGLADGYAVITKLKLLTGPEIDVRAVYRLLQICGSVWHCPVCAARIANERRQEIHQAVKLAEQLGYRVVLVTYTARHDRSTNLVAQLTAMAKAHEAVWHGAASKRLRERSGWLGMIRTLECTHSKRNGWHPHIHAIIFIKATTDVQWFEQTLRARWELCAAKYDLSMNEHGFDLLDSSSWVADYVAKWEHEPKWREADELARWHTKKGRPVREQDEHYSPWQLLDFADNGDAQAGKLWREYALTYYGRQQLHWSRGLRAALGMGQEITDEEAAEKDMEETVKMLDVYLSDEQWQWVKGNDLRTELLEAVEQHDADGIVDFCQQAYDFAPKVERLTRDA
jgi:hypothetical protein